MSSGHGHDALHAPRASERTTRILFMAVAAAFILTLAGALTVWPHDQSERSSEQSLPDGSSILYGVVTSVDLEADQAQVIVTGEEDQANQTMRLWLEFKTFFPEVGDHVKILEDGDGELVFWDFDRRSPMLWLFLAAVVVTIAVARWRGLRALLGLGIGLGVVVFFTVPALFDGHSPLLVGLVSGSAAMFVLLYLAHGVNARTTTALLGTLAGLGVTGLLGWWAVSATKLTGLWSDEGVHVTFLQSGASLTGIILCGVILAGLGVLNDVTITQASAVWELRGASPSASRRELYSRGMRIGRDHIASTVYTIAFAYLGAGLPVIMMATLYDASLVTNLTSVDLAEEVVRSLVGSIGLVLAVPLTTLIAAAVVGKHAIATDDEEAAAPRPLPPGARPARLGPLPGGTDTAGGRRAQTSARE